MRGRITTASGQSFSALNIGIAERTPVEPGDVAGGGDDAAAAAADDDRAVGEAGIVALLHRGVEGVAVEMGDGEAS